MDSPCLNQGDTINTLSYVYVNCTASKPEAEEILCLILDLRRLLEERKSQGTKEENFQGIKQHGQRKEARCVWSWLGKQNYGNLDETKR